MDPGRVEPRVPLEVLPRLPDKQADLREEPHRPGELPPTKEQRAHREGEEEHPGIGLRPVRFQHVQRRQGERGRREQRTARADQAPPEKVEEPPEGG